MFAEMFVIPLCVSNKTIMDCFLIMSRVVVLQKLAELQDFTSFPPTQTVRRAQSTRQKMVSEALGIPENPMRILTYEILQQSTDALSQSIEEVIPGS